MSAVNIFDESDFHPTVVSRSKREQQWEEQYQRLLRKRNITVEQIEREYKWFWHMADLFDSRHPDHEMTLTELQAQERVQEWRCKTMALNGSDECAHICLIEEDMHAEMEQPVSFIQVVKTVLGVVIIAALAIGLIDYALLWFWRMISR